LDLGPFIIKKAINKLDNKSLSTVCKSFKIEALKLKYLTYSTVFLINENTLKTLSRGFESVLISPEEKSKLCQHSVKHYANV